MKTTALIAALQLLPLALAAPSADAPKPPPGKLDSGVFVWDQLAFAPTKTGARVMVFDAPTPTLDRFHLHITTLNPGENTGALHRHPQEELVIIKEGTVEVNIEGKLTIATTGSMIFFAANRPLKKIIGHNV